LLKNLFGKSLGYTKLRMNEFGEQPAFALNASAGFTHLALNASAGKTAAKMQNYPISDYT